VESRPAPCARRSSRRRRSGTARSIRGQAGRRFSEAGGRARSLREAFSLSHSPLEACHGAVTRSGACLVASDVRQRCMHPRRPVLEDPASSRAIDARAALAARRPARGCDRRGSREAPRACTCAKGGARTGGRMEPLCTATSSRSCCLRAPAPRGWRPRLHPWPSSPRLRSGPCPSSACYLLPPVVSVPA
jgi:hypothetical protein